MEWDYLFYTLEKIGFGQRFISWVKLLYSSPMASFRTNNVHSIYFPLHRSMDQGCPLSPLLFAIAIEPLAIALRSDPSITGIIINGIEHRVSLYTDDLLLHVSILSASVPAALDILTSCGCISGCKLNLDKSEIFPLNDAARNSVQDFPFKHVLLSFSYLGIHVGGKFEDLFKFNFAPLLAQIQEDF